MNTTSNSKYLFLVAAISFLVLSAFFYWLLTSPSNNKTATEVTDSLFLLSSEDYSNAVTKTDEVLKLAQTPEEKTAASFLHARALLGRSEPGDLEKAVDLFKLVATNENTEPQRRAGAMVSLASIYYKDGTGEMMRSIVFNTTPFSTYLESAGNNTTNATFFLLDQANSIFPTTFAYTEIAKLARLEILRKQKDLQEVDNSTQKALAERIINANKQHQALSEGVAYLSEQVLIDQQITIALSTDQAERILPDQVTFDAVRAEYEKTLKMLDGASGEPIHLLRTGQILLFYAGSLQAHNTGNIYTDKIYALLREIVEIGTIVPELGPQLIREGRSVSLFEQFPSLLSSNADFARLIASAQESGERSKNQPLPNLAE